MTYSELQAAIASWLDRDDLTAEIPGFIDLCEAEINRQLRTGDQEIDVVIPSVEDQKTYDLPTTEKGWRAVRVGEILRYVTPHAMGLTRPLDKAWYYTLTDNKITFNTALDGVVEIELLGYSQVPALTDVDPTNWLSLAHQDVYLFGSLKHAEMFVKNPSRSAEMESIFLDKLGQVIERDKLDRWSGDTLVMKSDRSAGLSHLRSRSLRCR